MLSPPLGLIGANTGRRKIDGQIMRDDKDIRDRRLRYQPTHAIVINSALD